MPAIEAIVPALDRIDWDFPRSGSPPGSIHTLHWFPGNFIPQIPAFLIQVLSSPGDIVLDPFAGSGTTAIESLNLGRRAIATDRVTACVFLTAAKVAMSFSHINDQLKSELLADLTWDQICESDMPGRNGEGSDPQLANWYASRTLAQLRYLWTLIEQSPAPARGPLTLLFSDVLFSCASTARSLTSTGKIRKHHWGWVADNVLPKKPVEHNAIENFRDRLSSLSFIRVMNPSIERQAVVFQQDARAMALPSESVDLIMTSPPYIGVIDYTRANRLLYLWMGWPFDEDRRQEIGARYKRGRLPVRFVEEYESEMDACWRELRRVLRRDSYCAIVIGESRTFRGTVDRTLDKLRQLMPMVWGPVERLPSRRRVSDRMSSQPVEYICVFRKT